MQSECNQTTFCAGINTLPAQFFLLHKSPLGHPHFVAQSLLLAVLYKVLYVRYICTISLLQDLTLNASIITTTNMISY